MKSIQIQLTTKCNQRCYMCRKYIWERKEIDFDILKEKILKYKNCTFSFSGGDPLEYSKLKELAEFLAENNITYQVFSNLNYILNDDMKLFLNNAKYIQVSFDGSNDATYTSVRRQIENGINTVKENINKYANKIKLNCTVSKRNYFDVKNIYDCFNNKVLDVRFFLVHTDENAKIEPYMIDFIINQYKNEIIPLSIKKLIYNKQEKFEGKCFVKKEHRLVDEDGKEYPCCRAINDNGEDWKGINCIDNLKQIDDENVLYDFCSNCDRYKKFNENWEEYKNKEKVFL